MDRTIKNLYLSERMSDVTFYVGGKTDPIRFPAHKLIMANSSQVFERMFEGEFKERTDAHVNIPDGDPIAFKSILSFIYREHLTLESVNHACNIVYLVDKYNMDKSIFEICASYFTTNVCLSNCCEILNTIVQHPVMVEKNAGKLLKAIWQIIAKNTEEFARLETFNQLSSGAIDLVLRCDFLQISSEAVMFKVLLDWADQRCLKEHLSLSLENKKKVIGNLIYSVRFSCFPLKTFLMGPEVSELLTDEDKIQIESCISDKNKTWRPLNGKHGCQSRISTLLNRFLKISSDCSNVTADHEVILVSFSHDVILSKLNIRSDFHAVRGNLQISSLHEDNQWEIGNCHFTEEVSREVFREYSLGIDDVCLKAKKTYKINLKLTAGYKMFLSIGVDSGVQESVFNDRCFRFIFKVLRSTNVSRREIDEAEDWIKLKAKLDEEEPDEPVTQYANSVFFAFSLTVCPQ